MIKSLSLLPPPPDCCQQCAEKHAPEKMHNAQTLYYGFWFEQQHGRSPTWADAMDHCSDQDKFHMRLYLENLGIDINSTNLTGNIKSKKDLESRLGKIN